jgi:hypothetical protein
MRRRSRGRSFVFSLVLLAWWCPSANSQLISLGVKGGIPLTDPLSTRQGGSGGVGHDVRRYLVGPTGELHLPFGFSVEVDALYRPLNYTEYPTNLSPLPGDYSPVAHTGSDWQFPILAKYEFHKGIIVHPFVDGGVTYRHVSFSNVSLGDASTAGISVGGGLTFRLLFVRLSPEFRYTRFPTDVFGSNFNYVHSTSNQADFLVGLTF